MRGFQPAAQNYAEGGMVSRIKGALGFTPKEDKKKEPAPSTAPAPAPEPSTAVGQYAAGSALKRRMAEIDSYANGGPVRGPGTGTSDEVPDEVPEGTYIMPTDSTQAIGEQSLATMGKGKKVPVNLSNGEFKMPPEQVHAIGVQALDQMKGATHAPVSARGFAPGAQQQTEPPLFFANGGVVDEDARRRAMVNQIPTGGATAPAPAAPAPVQSVASQPLEAQAASDRAKFGAAWDTVKDVNDSAGRAIADVATMVPRGLAGAYDSAVVRPMRAAGVNAGYLSPHLAPNGVDPSSMTPFTDQKRMREQPAPVAASAPAATVSVAAAAPPATPSAPQAGASTAGAGRGSINPPLVNPSVSTSTAVPAQPSTTEISPGVFRSGNSYSDSAAGAMAGTQTRGLPSAQNVAAADALAQRYQAQSMGSMAGQPVERGWSGVIGTDPAAGRERKNLVDSLMTPMKGAQNSQLTAAQRGGMLSLLDQEARGLQSKANNATALQQTEMQTGTQRDMAAMREAGDTSRAFMRESGETGRAGARNAIDQGRLGLEQQTRGFEIRAGERQEKLYQKYEAAKTPEEKSAVAQQIRDLSGKQQESPWKVQVTPSTKNLDGSTTEGSIYRYNGQSGQVERVDAGAAPKSGPITPQSKAEYDALPKGAQYMKDGKVLIKG